ncbi:hypothetical protein GF343_00545 [Candidatus Woesearchaeota archaeon]|nr:hypothetical protein [Candidatus Woesearchaeota archaeon]
MKNKILGIMILLVICLISVSVAQAGCSEGICCDKDLWAKLSENELHFAHANNVEYEINVIVISETSKEAKFKINGQITDALSEGEEYTLADDSVIEVKKIITDESPSKVIICFDYGNLQNSKSINIAEVTPAPQQKYAPGQEVTFRLKATENFENGIASPDEGFNIQFYTFDATEFTEDQMFHGAGIPGDYIPVDIVKQYNANFMSPHWTATFNVPQNPGKYYTLFTLYCSRDQNTCGHDNVLRGAHSKYLIKYEVEGDAPRQNYACDGHKAILADGEKETYVIGRTEYEIKAEKHKGNFKLNVNGEYTDWLYIETKQTMADRLQIKILDVGSDDITFCMTPGPAPPEQSQPENKIDLSNFPELFIKGNRLNGNFVVGDQAPADDVIAAIDISVSFQKYGVSKTGGAMLASEVSNYNRNIISVGRPCDNAVTAQILRSNGISAYDSNCSYGLKPGQAVVYLFEYNEYAHMLVFGYSRLETRKAARALTFQKLKGTRQWLTFDEDMPQPEEPPEETAEPEPARDIPECQKELERFKKELVEKYDNKGLPIPESFMVKYDSLHKSCFGYTENQKPPVTEETYEDCPGCRKNGACMQIGIRFLEGDAPVYCDIDHAFKPQKENGKTCMNNYECLSNTCQDGVCQSMSEQIQGIQRELEEQKSILEKIMGFFKRMFSF